MVYCASVLASTCLFQLSGQRKLRDNSTYTPYLIFEGIPGPSRDEVDSCTRCIIQARRWTRPKTCDERLRRLRKLRNERMALLVFSLRKINAMSHEPYHIPMLRLIRLITRLRDVKPVVLQQGLHARGECKEHRTGASLSHLTMATYERFNMSGKLEIDKSHQPTPQDISPFSSHNPLCASTSQ